MSNLYAFQGQESDDEIKGEGNSYDFGARMFDSRLGRWLTIDPQFKKQPEQSSYKAFFNNPLRYIDPNGQTEYESVVITDEKTGKVMKMTVTKSNKLKTDGKVYSDNFAGLHQQYFDYRHVTYITLHKDGTQSRSVQKTEILVNNGAKYKDYVPLDYLFGTTAKNGSIYDPNDPFVQEGGLYMTGSNGQGTKYHSKNAEDIGNIDYLLSIMSNYSAKPDLKIPKDLTAGNLGWEAVEQVMKNVDRQGETMEKIIEIVEAIEALPKGNGGEKEYNDAGGNPNNTPSNRTYWSKPEGSQENEGTGTIATPEEMKKGDTLGGNPQVNIFPSKK